MSDQSGTIRPALSGSETTDRATRVVRRLGSCPPRGPETMRCLRHNTDWTPNAVRQGRRLAGAVGFVHTPGAGPIIGVHTGADH
jgi:hypothetical protein